jgi:hypothetical protein
VAVAAPSQKIPCGVMIRVALPPERPRSPERVLALMGQRRAGFGKIKKIFCTFRRKNLPPDLAVVARRNRFALSRRWFNAREKVARYQRTVARWCGFPLPTPALKAEAASATPLFARFQGWDTQEAAQGESRGHQHTTQR